MSYPDQFSAGNQLSAQEANDYTLNPAYTYGETIAAGDVLYMKAADSKVYKAQADTLAHIQAVVGLALAAGSANDTNAILGPGKVVTGLSGLTAGSPVYLSNTAGAYATSAGDFPLVIGVAISTTAMLVTIGLDAGTQNAILRNIGHGTSGEALAAAGKALYMKAADGKLYKATGTANEAGNSFVGFSLNIVSGASEDVWFVKPGGVSADQSGLTIGLEYFLDASTAGAITATPPAMAYPAGLAISATELLVKQGLRVFSQDFSSTAFDGNGTAVTCGFRPKLVLIVFQANTAGSTDNGTSCGVYGADGNGVSCKWEEGANTFTASAGTFVATGCTITLSNTGSATRTGRVFIIG